MRQCVNILLFTSAVIIVMVALLISSLRLALPQLGNHHTSVLNFLSSVSDHNIQAKTVRASWQSFGPALEFSDLDVTLKEGDSLKIGQLTLALDIWQTLLHARWQFRDLTFKQLNFTTSSPIVESKNNHTFLNIGEISDLFLRQFDYFNLRDSAVSFLTPSGQRVELSIPQLTWRNEKKRHRVEGEVSLFSLTGQHGVMQVRLDLHDDQGLLDNGRIWMQADNIDVKPWFGQWIPENIDLNNAHFNLAAWITLKQGEVKSSDIWLKKGGADWRDAQRAHRLDVDNLQAHITRVNRGWSVGVAQTRLKTDGADWPQGQFSVLWLPQETSSEIEKREEWRLRAAQFDLRCLEPLVPLFAKAFPPLVKNWRVLQPHGKIEKLALDVPVKYFREMRFHVEARNVSWHQWRSFPGMEHLSGSLYGNATHGRLTLQVENANLPYEAFFRAKLDIKQANGIIDWYHSQDGLRLEGKGIDIQARSLWVKGDFNYHQPKNQPPRLEVLAGINVADAADAWRYFPEPLMGQSLFHYLRGAIKGGEVKDATLIFAGDLHKFPFRHGEGKFEVAVPLRNAQYQFEPNWPMLENLAIDLDFVNAGLWMNAPKVMLGKITAENISAIIPDYQKEKLLIDGVINGEGADIRDYFYQSPLRSSLGAALDELQIAGKVNGNLHLDIPLDGQQTQASGDVQFNNNTLYIKPLNSTLTQLTGNFSYKNGNLHSNNMYAIWFGQPLSVHFDTVEDDKVYRIGVNLQGHWQPAQITVLPKSFANLLQGSAAWQGNLAIELPPQGEMKYEISAETNLRNVSSNLPSPLQKKAGKNLPIKVSVSGDSHRFNLSASLGKQSYFNSRWRMDKHLHIDRAILVNDSRTLPELPARSETILSLPPLDAESWLPLIAAAKMQKGATGRHSRFGDVMLQTPSLTLAGQQWGDLQVILSQKSTGTTEIQAQGKQIQGSLIIADNAVWDINLDYLYYNPTFSHSRSNHKAVAASKMTLFEDFKHWPELNIFCQECWVNGQKIGLVKGSLLPKDDTLTLSHGLIDNGSARLQVDGSWINARDEQLTSLKGKLSGNHIDEVVNEFGVSTPLRKAPFSIDYDLYWHAAPWQPSAKSLGGVLKSHFGKGEINNIYSGGGRQLLRLISVDALFRKLSLDFNNTFGRGFYFDSINATAWIDKGVMQTDHLLVDGFEAGIEMHGKLDLVNGIIDMQAIVTPEISATVSVATAFVVNPMVGAAVFAATKMLGPLWNKISLLRYHIGGTFDKPEIKEMFRKPRSDSAK